MDASDRAAAATVPVVFVSQEPASRVDDEALPGGPGTAQDVAPHVVSALHSPSPSVFSASAQEIVKGLLVHGEEGGESNKLRAEEEADGAERLELMRTTCCEAVCLAEPVRYVSEHDMLFWDAPMRVRAGAGAGAELVQAQAAGEEDAVTDAAERLQLLRRLRLAHEVLDRNGVHSPTDATTPTTTTHVVTSLSACIQPSGRHAGADAGGHLSQRSLTNLAASLVTSLVEPVQYVSEHDMLGAGGIGSMPSIEPA